MDHLLRYKGRSAMILRSSQGLELKGSFTAVNMVLPHNCGSSSGTDAGGGAPAMQEVLLFMGSPRFHGLSELQVRGSRHEHPCT